MRFFLLPLLCQPSAVRPLLVDVLDSMALEVVPNMKNMTILHRRQCRKESPSYINCGHLKCTRVCHIFPWRRDPTSSSWGPAIGATEIYAKCFTVEEACGQKFWVLGFYGLGFRSNHNGVCPVSFCISIILILSGVYTWNIHHLYNANLLAIGSWFQSIAFLTSSWSMVRQGQ